MMPSMPTASTPQTEHRRCTTIRWAAAQSSVSARRPLILAWRAVMSFFVLTLFLLSVSLSAQQGPPPLPAGEPASLRFPVVHAHFGSWCFGYLTITPAGVRYEALQPESKSSHTFDFDRANIAFLNFWLIGGQYMNAVEIRNGRGTYHFWLLRAAAEHAATRRPAWKPMDAAPVDPLLLSLHYWRVTGRVPRLEAVNRVLAQARMEASRANNATAANNNDPAAVAAGNLNNQIFINTYSNTVTTHTMNTINTMSHW